MVLRLVEAIDVYLAGTVMLIFGMGLYGLFISDVPPDAASNDDRALKGSSLFGMFSLKERPKWIKISYLDELKTKVGHVIVMILLVKMFERSKMVAISTGMDLLSYSVHSKPLIYKNCTSLTSLWSKSNELPDTLGKIKLSGCSNLATLASRGNLPKALRYLSITECSKLESIAKTFHDNMKLEKLYIFECDSLTCIARVQLPPNLKRLHIEDCCNLLTVSEEEQVSGSCMNTPSLEYLKIENCPSLTSLWSKSNELPDTLGKIKLSGCSNLATLASRGNLPKALRYLSITECSKLESIAKTFHDNMKLEKLYILHCEKLETLPSGINNLISLRKLAIHNCPGIVSIPVGGFPTKVTFLSNNGMEICKLLFEWGLYRLTSLELLGIGGCPDVMSFPQEETRMILPNSLTTLVIGDFPNLERLSSVVQNLTSLEKLGLSDCPKLEYFPENGLPKSLKQLEISGCPLLEERCKEGEGVYWPMIRHLSDNISESFSSEEDD